MEKRETLKATIGLPQAIALYIGAVLGSGVLLVPGLAAEMAGPASLLAWGLMAVLVLPMALVMGLFGQAGAVVVGVTGIFICTATIIAYIGATSRLAYALANAGNAPKPLAYLSPKHGTPLGGLLFLALCFLIVLILYGTKIVSLTTLIQFPNATFMLTYLGGCAAGIRLLRGTKMGVQISWISFILTALVLPFVGWAILYPLVILVGLTLYAWRKKSKDHKRNFPAA